MVRFLLVVRFLVASHCLLPPESVSALYEAWKGNTLTRSILRDYSSARLDSFFESRGLARDAVLLFSLLSPGCKFLESPRFPGTPVASGFSSSRVSLAPVSAHSVPGIGVSASLLDSSCSLPSGGSSPLCPGSESHVPTVSLPESSSSHTGLQGIVRGAAPVDVEQGVPLAPSPGSSSSTSKRKCPLEPDGRAGHSFSILDATGELASIRVYQALDYILTVTSGFAIASGPW